MPLKIVSKIEQNDLKQNQINSYVSINTDIFLSRYELKLSFYFNAHAYVMAFCAKYA